MPEKVRGENKPSIRCPRWMKSKCALKCFDSDVLKVENTSQERHILIMNFVAYPIEVSNLTRCHPW